MGKCAWYDGQMRLVQWPIKKRDVVAHLPMRLPMRRLQALSHAGRTAIGARVVRSFEIAVWMQHNRTRMAHHIGIGNIERCHVVADANQPVDDIAVKTRFDIEA
jgi:hypothetical protein